MNMKNNLNIAELLESCPTGMELDCVTYDNVSFDKVHDDKKFIYPISCYITDKEGNRNTISFTKNGCESRHCCAKCVIFPKGKTTWEGFQSPFKDGDVLISKSGKPFIFKRLNNNNSCYSYCGIDSIGQFKLKSDNWTSANSLRGATEEEKQKLFDAIKANGYEWNPETKTLEKLIEPKFKVGDKVKNKDGYVIDIIEIDTNKEEFKYKTPIGAIGEISFNKQNNYELVPNKFDITTLKPFESKVLVRNNMDALWKPAVFGFRNGYDDNAFYIVGGSCWKQCIPYLNNEHLCGTTNNCDEYFKTWE